MLAVRSFAAMAARDELGLTNPLVPEEIVPFGDPAVLAKMDHVPDPELSLAALQSFADFTRLLAAPERGAITADVEAGTRVFAATGCAECHLPSWTTGSSADAVLSGRTFAPYWDLLLHDLGIADGVPQGDASGREIRTPPLWGLRFRSDLLHDGSASSVTEALAQHGGEAAEVRRRFESLSGSERAQLFAFLRSR